MPNRVRRRMGVRFVYFIYRLVIGALYAILRLSPAHKLTSKKQVAFLSRQSDEPSLDFRLLEAALRERLPGWEFATACYRDTGNTLVRIRGTIRQLRLVARSRLCIVDGYTPAVSIPHLDDETIVIQLWHALGAFKRFGWSAVGTPGGRTEAQARGLHMHRNYTLVVAGGEGACAAFAQAFNYPVGNVAPLGLPRMDYLTDCSLACERKITTAGLVELYPQLVDGRTNVLFAPTFRREKGRFDAHRHIQALAEILPASEYNLMVAFHPLSSQGTSASSIKAASPTYIPHAKSIDLLEVADYVITDYSTIAFEAALLEKKVVFFVPDITDYRHSPGLTVDPQQEFPAITFTDIAALAHFIEVDRLEDRYAVSGFPSFCDSYLTNPAAGATERLATLISRMVA